MSQIIRLGEPAAVFNKDGQLLEINDAFKNTCRSYLGFDIKTGDNISKIGVCGPEENRLLLLCCQRALAGERCSITKTLTLPGLPAAQYEVSFSPCSSENGHADTAYFIWHNMTPQNDRTCLPQEYMAHLGQAVDSFALVVAIDQQGHIQHANRQAEIFLQQPPGSLRYRNFCEAAACQPEEWSAFLDLVRSGLKSRIDIRCNTSLHTPLWLDLQSSPLTCGDPGYLLIGFDITSRKQQEQKARDDEQFFRHVVENLPIGLHEFQQDGLTVNMNSQQRNIWGADHPIFKQPDYNILNDPFYQRNGLTQLFREVIQRKTPIKREIIMKYRERHAAGTTRLLPAYYEATMFPLPSQHGHLFLILNEITEKKLAEISLEKSERLLDNIIENMPIGYIQFDNLGYIRRINQTQREFFDTPDKVSRLHYNIMSDTFARNAGLHELFLQVLRENQPLRVERRLDFSQAEQWTNIGREVFLDLTIFPVQDPVDKDEIVVVLVNDISDKKLQEAENIQYQEFLQQTGRVGKIGGWEMDIASGRLRWSAETYRIYGIPQGTTVEMNELYRYYAPDTHREIERLIQLCIDKQQPFDVQFDILTGDNQSKRIRTIGQPHQDTLNPGRIYGVVQDITEQYQIRDELSRNIELMRLFFDTIDMGYASIEKEGTLNFLNQKAEQIIGKKVPVGTNILTVMPDLHDTPFELRLLECAEQQRSQSFGSYFRHTDKWYDFLLAPMRDGAISLFIRDVTESRNLQRDLRKANEQLSSLNNSLVNQNKQLEDFAHITSHNLRAPIANLKALMQMHNESAVSHERELYLGMLHEVIKKTDETLNDLVEVVQIRKDMNVERELLSFADRLQKVKDILRADMDTSGIQLTYDFNEAHTIEYPRVYLDSILQNLITNAIRYRAAERIPTLHLQTRRIGNDIELSAIDNGIGIDMERFGSKLFGFRKTFHKNKEAKGIGLFITKTQVEAMGGSIRAESKPGAGTKFIITFRPESSPL
ncbi:PAS domain-containing protein [Chitinophaga pendula]|uniref:PAS domain-containing sensor histidine kinase n=1 Tax=Chitinophaga TaxID=79328 RepID=UPI000BAEE820|nr:MULTISPECIES: PAS domain-containing sensor histidine kinase [Chitinophaga]ASZ13611.1 hypothetical protein CK934_22995 [Chitinophaga sp. MD30]UCJ08764.1 PAS domain-containing protein [Chitinophaga pendula]